MRKLLCALLLAGCVAGSPVPVSAGDAAPATAPARDLGDAERVDLSPEQWKARLTPEQYAVLREKHTERPGTGHLLHNHAAGTYVCAGCGAPLFSSDSKFESGTGWPSFTAAIDGRVDEEGDVSLGMTRTEILCARCGGHLGHVFDDGPAPTGLRYCVNSVSLEFVPSEE